MKRFFTFLGTKIQRNPFRFLLGTLGLFALFLVSGIPQIELATGNNTLVHEDNQAYQSNQAMEDGFGGDAIIVLFEDETGEYLLSLENLGKMWEIEQKLQYEEAIFTIVSPASTVNHLSKMQSEVMVENLSTMSEGLETIADQLITIGAELSGLEMVDPAVLEERFENIAQVTERFDQLANGQDGINQAGIKLEEGLGATSEGLEEMSSAMQGAAPQAGADPSAQFTALAENLATISDNLGTMGQNTTQIQEASSKTSEALSMMEEKLGSEFSSLQEELAGFQQMDPALFGDLVENLGAAGGQLLNMVEPDDPEDPKNIQLKQIGNQLVGMSSQLDEQLGSIELTDTAALEEKLQGIDLAADQLTELARGQDGLNEAGVQLEEGLSNTAAGLAEMADQVQRAASTLGQQTDAAGQLETLAENLSAVSQNLGTMGENTIHIQDGSRQTSDALTRMGETMAAEFSAIQADMEGLQDLDPEKFRELAEGLGTMGENLLEMSEGLEVFAENSAMMVANFPATQDALDTLLFEDGDPTALRPMFEQMLPDENHAQMMIRIEGEEIADQAMRDELIAKVSQLVDDAGFETVTPIVSGQPVLDSSLRTEMQQNMAKMMGMALLIMIIILLLTFHVRSRLMPLVTVFVGVIATIGLMGVLGVPITMVSMAVFPILIGLGINYSIQLHNRYEEDQSVSTTIKNVGTAVAISVIATMLGFVSLYVSPVPMIQDFGSMLTIGVALAFVGGLFILMPTFEIRDVFSAWKRDNITYEEESTRKSSQRRIRKEAKSDGPRTGNRFSKLFSVLGRYTVRFRIPILISVMILAGLGFYADKNVGVETNIETFMPQNMASLEDVRYVRDVMGAADQLTLHVKDDETLAAADRIEWLDETVQELEETYPEIITGTQSLASVIELLPGSDPLETSADIRNALNDLPESQKKLLINEDYTETVVTVFISELTTRELEAFINDVEAHLEDAPMDVSVTGRSVLDLELVDGLTSGRMEMTLLGLILVYLSLAIIYRSLTRPMVAVLPVLVIVGISSGIMYLLGVDFTPLTSTMGALILGMGTEMNVMSMERYLEERYAGYDKYEAAQISLKNIGTANLASALTTIGGFSVLIASDFVILKDFGIMAVISVSLATLGTFIILPPLQYTMDSVLFSKKEKHLLKHK